MGLGLLAAAVDVFNEGVDAVDQVFDLSDISLLLIKSVAYRLLLCLDGIESTRDGRELAFVSAIRAACKQNQRCCRG